MAGRQRKGRGDCGLWKEVRNRQDRGRGGYAGMNKGKKGKGKTEDEGVLYVATEEKITYSAAMSHYIPCYSL